MSCPVDNSRCPIGGNAELFMGDWNQPRTLDQSWKSNQILGNKVYCKFHIKATRTVNDRWQHTNMNIKIESLSGVSAFLLKSKTDDFSSSMDFDISSGMTRSFTRLQGNEEFWIVYEPEKFRDGNIKIQVWVEHYQMPQSEKDYILKLEEADKKVADASDAQRLIDEAKKKAE